MTTSILITLGAIALCLLISAFFSASETAITAVSRARIYHLILEGNLRARAVGNLRKHKERMLGGLMIGNNMFNILGTSLATELAIRHWGEHGVAYASIAMTVIVVIFAEVLPKTYAIQHAESTALRLSPVMVFSLRLLQPFGFALHFLIRHMLRLIGADAADSVSSSDASDVIRGTIELHHHEGKVVKQDRDMLGGILDLEEIEVGEIMEHRLSMETIDADLPAERIITLAVESTHSRIPLWQGEADNIVGVLHVKTMIQRMREAGGTLNNQQILGLLAKPWFVPKTTPIKKQLHAFRAERQHLALVVDEYGVLLGLVTLEDIIEVIVGRIDDEHDKQVVRDLLPAGENAWYVLGSMSIRDLNRDLGWSLPDEDAATIAGLVIHEAQLIPEVGQRFTFHDIEFTILDKQGNQVTRLKVEKLTAKTADSSRENA